MSALRWMLCIGLLTCALGCGKSTARWCDHAKSADPAQRLEAVHALGQRTGDADTVMPILIESLKDDDTYVRRDSARALGRFGPLAKPATAALQARLSDREPSVRKAAAAALKAIDVPLFFAHLTSTGRTYARRKAGSWQPKWPPSCPDRSAERSQGCWWSLP